MSATAVKVASASMAGNIVDCEWSSFLRLHGRPPLISDLKKPWQYKGWLLYYRMLLEERIGGRRWDYWFRTMEAGTILDAPIPRIEFSSSQAGERSRGYQAIDKWIDLIQRKGRGWSSLNDLIEWLLWGFGLAGKPPAIERALAEALYRAVDIGELLLEPFDYLGEWIASHKGRWNPTAFFPTPHAVVDMMVSMQLDGIEKRSSVCDPCLGSGRMLLHASNSSLRLYGCDIDPRMVAVAKINGILYAPWMVMPFPASFFGGGDTLAGLEVRNSIENPPLAGREALAFEAAPAAMPGPQGG